MYPAPFDYVRAGSLAEAVAVLAQHGDEAKLLAGGHSLLPLMKLRLASPRLLVDIGRLPELRGIREEGGALAIGAATRHVEVAGADAVRQRLPALAEAAAGIGDLQVRNRGTLGGSLAHADPSADLPAVAVALDAQLVAVGPGGERTIAADDFFLDALATALAPDEVVREVRYPLPSGRAGSAYVKVPHLASGYAVVGCAARVELDANGRCASARVAFSGLGSPPPRARATEQRLVGQALDAAAVETAAAVASEGLEVWDDLDASAEYRRHLATVCARQALAAALERA